MISRKFKIGRSDRIKQLLKKGVRIHSRFFRISFLRNSIGQPRFSIITSSKTGKTAVERNSIRRRVYEALRKNIHLCLPSTKKTCYDVIVLFSPQVKNLSFSELVSDLAFLMKKLP